MRSKIDPRMRKEINNENNIRVKPAGAPTEYTMKKNSTETNTENNTLKTEKHKYNEKSNKFTTQTINNTKKIWKSPNK